VSVHPTGPKGTDETPSRDRHDAEHEETEVKGEQAVSTSWPEDDEDAWLEEVGNPYHKMVAAAVSERVVAAAFCYPAEYWLLSRPVRRLIRRIRGQARWDDRLPSLGLRHSVVALTESSLMVFEYRIDRGSAGLGPCLGRWARDEIFVDVCRTELTLSSNGQTDRMDVLTLDATTPDGQVALLLPAGEQPGIKDFEQALGG
jgi:hypothetical protein